MGTSLHLSHSEDVWRVPLAFHPKGYVTSLVCDQFLTFNPLGKNFILYATLNIGAMGTFSLILLETKGRGLEEMDILFGTVSSETR